MWTIPSIWEGGDVFILGGGPSVIKQFNIPDSVYQKVLNKSLPLNALSPYMLPIHSKHVIGINVAYQIGPWMDIIFFGDLGFYLEHTKKLNDYPGLKVSCHDCVIPYKFVKFLPRDQKVLGISKDRNHISWNFNSGAAAISLAAYTGVKRIFLLGFDMKLVEDKQHWHDQYNLLKKRETNPVIPAFITHLKGFPQIAIDAKKMGIEIVNLNPDSAITVFPKCNLKDIL